MKVKNISALVSLALLCLFVLSGCGYLSPCGNDKKEYVDRFRSFIKEAKEMKSDASESIWERMDERFEQLSETCYEQWEDELSIKDKATIATWIMQYQYYRVGRPIIEEIIE
jgi:hypothetical protein